MDVASYYPRHARVPNECFIERTTAAFIRKSSGHIGVLFKNKNLIYRTITALQTSSLCLYQLMWISSKQIDFSNNPHQYVQ